MADEKKTDRFWRLIGGGKSASTPGSAAPGAGEATRKSDAAPHAPAVAPQSGDARQITQPFAVAGRKKPNVLLLLTDDQGYGDLSCLGSGYICTPHIDRLAAAGSLCTSFYAASPACSPARAALLSGVSPSAAGVRSMLPAARDAIGIPADLMLLPQRLGEAGYRTGYWGKWHLGGDAQSRPEAHGFSETFYFLSEEIDPFSHIHYGAADSDGPAHDLWENGQEVHEDGQFLTERMTEKLLAFIRENREMPFFAVMAYTQPHFPLTLPHKYLSRFSRLPRAEQLYAAGLSAVDDSVGLILDELIRLGEAQNTLILFTSDHGPSRDSRQRLDGTKQPFDVSQNRLRGGKYSLFEGGLRVPGIYSWPAMLPTGQWMPDVVSALDFVPTVLAAAGIAIPEGLQGVNLIPRLCGDAPLPTRDLYWEMMGQTALRSGRWKLVLNGQLDEKTPSDSPLHLSDMESDPGETQNLFATYSGMGNEMTDRAMKWRMEVEDYWEKRHAARYAAPAAKPAPVANG